MGRFNAERRHGQLGSPAPRFQRHAPDTGKANSQRLAATRPSPLSPEAAMLEAWCGTPQQGRSAISVNSPEPSFATTRQRTAGVEGGTHLYKLPQQGPAHPPSPARAVGRWPGRSGARRFGSPQGRQASRGGDGPCADPLEAGKTRFPQFLWATRLKSPGLTKEIETRQGSRSFCLKIGHCNDTTFLGLLQRSHRKVGTPWRGDTTRRRFADAKRPAKRSGHT